MATQSPIGFLMPKRPNILWYCSDQQRFDTIEGLNNEHIHTPRLKRFMDTAVTFTHAHCQTQICTPSRASFLTGMYPSAVGVLGNGNPYFPPEQSSRLITRILADAGFDVGNVGKLHLAGAGGGAEQRTDDGYRYFQYSHSHKGPDLPFHDYADWIRLQGSDPAELIPGNWGGEDSYRRGAEVKSFGGLFEPTESDDNVPPRLHQTHWCTEKGIEFINANRNADQPWMLTLNPFDPHAPFDAPYEYYRRYDPAALPGAHFRDSDIAHQQRLVDAGVDFQSKPKHPRDWDHRKIQASYYAMIEQIDHEFGRLLDHLEAIGERENTIVIFTSDHGEALCDHGMILKGCRFFEGLVRVPLMISWPGRFAGGNICDGLVELTDLVPTLYEALGMEVPYHVQGKSLLPVLAGSDDGSNHRDYVRTEFYGAINHADQTHATMYRTRRWKLVTYHGKGVCELYDLESDPWEHEDLSRDPGHADVLQKLLCEAYDAQAYARTNPVPRTYSF